MSSAADAALIVGIGQAERRDDGVGPYVAGTLALRGLPAVVHGGDGTGLLDLWEGRRLCLVVDAMSGPAPSGHIAVFTDFDDPVFAAAGFVHSTHRIGLPEAVALGRALARLPDRLVVVGIGGSEFAFGTALSPPVAATAERLIATLTQAQDPFADETLAALRTL